MTYMQALNYWITRFKQASNYSDTHWDAEERHAHDDYCKAMGTAIRALALATMMIGGDKGGDE